MSNVSGNTSSNVNAYANQSSGTQSAERVSQPTTGNGVTAPASNTPDVPMVPISMSLADVMASLASLGIDLDADDVTTAILRVAEESRDVESNSQKGRIELDQFKVKGMLNEQAQKIADAEKKREEAKESRHSASLADKFKLAFEWIGAVVAIAVAAVMIATGVGAVVGALLIAAAVTAIIMAADSTMKMTSEDGMGIGAAMAGAGASPEAKKKADMIFGITMAVAGAVFSMAGGGAGVISAARGAIQAGVAAGRATYSLTESVGATVKAVASAMKEAYSAIRASQQSASSLVNFTKASLEVTESASTAGNTAAGITATSYRTEAEHRDADAKRLKAGAETDQTEVEILNQAVDQAFARLMAAGDKFNTIIEDLVGNLNDLAKLTGSARIAG